MDTRPRRVVGGEGVRPDGRVVGKADPGTRACLPPQIRGTDRNRSAHPSGVCRASGLWPTAPPPFRQLEMKSRAHAPLRRRCTKAANPDHALLQRQRTFELHVYVVEAFGSGLRVCA